MLVRNELTKLRIEFRVQHVIQQIFLPTSKMTTITPGLDAKALDRFGASLQSDIDKGLLYGASVIIARHGKIGLQKTFGTVSPDGRAGADDDLYLMMSLSKSFTAALMIHAIDQGRFTLDTKVASVLPKFGVDGKQNVTIRHLLTHTAGTFAAMVPPGLTPQDIGNLDKIFDSIAMLPAAYKPGSQCCYNPMASYATLAKMLVVTDPKKRSWSEIAHQDLFEPLGMKDTSYGIAPDNTRRVPACYTEKNSTPKTPFMVNLYTKCLAGNAEVPAGNAFSTVQDVFRFTEMVRGRGSQPKDGCRYMSKSTFDYASRIHTGAMINQFWEADREANAIGEPFVANFTLLGGYARGEGHNVCGCGYTASPGTIYAIGGGTTMWLVDPERQLTFIFLSCGFIDGLAHFARLRRLSDLALAACE